MLIWKEFNKANSVLQGSVILSYNIHVDFQPNLSKHKNE